VLVCLLVLLIQATEATAAPRVEAREQQILSGLNEIRRQHHLAPLRISQELSTAARSHAHAMAASGTFAHNFAGVPFASWIVRYYPQPRAGHWLAGENILWSSPPESGRAAVTAWMASPEHKANILDPAYRQIGIAIIDVANAPGDFGHNFVTIAVTDFGARTSG
jgi:uncharacterized protein YkwD